MVCNTLGYAAGEVYTFGSALGIAELPIVTSNRICNGTEASIFECAATEVQEACTHSLDLGAVCYDNQTSSQVQPSRQKCQPTDLHSVPDPNQPLAIGCVDFYSSQCSYNVTDGSFKSALERFATCTEARQPPGYCHGSLSSTAELRNEAVCSCGASADVGFHIRIPFFVHAPGQYAFRLHSKFGRGSFMGVDGVRINPDTDSSHILFGPSHFDRGDHEIEVLGFEDCCDSKVEIEVHLPCDGPLDLQAKWRILSSTDGDCLLCGQDPPLRCLSDETALSSELVGGISGGIPESDTRHAICGADQQWHGSFPQCIECSAADIEAGRCGAICAFGVDDEPPVEHASWGECNPGGTLSVGQECTFLCDEGFVSYAHSGELGKPHAICTALGMRSVELKFEGYCISPQCVDNGAWATEFPSTVGNITAPLLCNLGVDAAECRREHSKRLTDDTQEAEREAQQQAMFFEPEQTQPILDPIETQDAEREALQAAMFSGSAHVLLYSIESTAIMHTMFDDGFIQSRPASEIPANETLPLPGASVNSAKGSVGNNTLCADDLDWNSGGRGCQQYADSNGAGSSLCNSDIGRAANGEQVTAIDACPATCGRCTNNVNSGHRRSMQHSDDGLAVVSQLNIARVPHATACTIQVRQP
eukprot:SAG31_NODE_2473_length_5638_cov_3.074134_2_plen_647_part_00